MSDDFSLWQDELKPLDPVDEIKRRISEIEEKVAGMQIHRDLLATQINESHLRDRETKEWFEKEVLRLREERSRREQEEAANRSAASQEARLLNREINELRAMIDGLSTEYASILEKRAMALRLEKAEKAIIEIAKDSIWYQKAAPFQLEDITFATNVYLEGKRGIANFNEMGTGKTMESAALNQILTHLFEEEHGRKPLRLWLTKKSLTKSNLKEIRKWCPDEKPIVVRGDKDGREFAVELAMETGQLIITNYEAVRTTKIIQKIHWDFVYIDEVHKLKGGANPSGPTAIWENIKNVCAKARFVVMLTGSPILNHPREMWSYLHIFRPDHFPTVRQFEREFCWGYGEGVGQVDFTRLITVMADQSFRRTKAEVSSQLKALDIKKLWEQRDVEMTPEQAAVYGHMRDRFFIWLDEEHEKALTASVVIAQLTRLRQMAMWPAGVKYKDADGVEHTVNVRSSGKMDEAEELITELVETGENVLFFSSQFNEPMFELRRRLALANIKCELITGENSDKTQELEQAFQQGEIQVLGINMRTGSEGLNLQKNPDEWPGGSSNVVFLDRWWNPESNKQAEDRLVRFGQTDVVTVFTLHCENSVDDFIAALNAEKEAMIHGIMESEKLRSPGDWKQYLEGLI